jgi:hypothetical protein
MLETALGALPEVELSLIIRASKRRSTLNGLLNRIDASLMGASWEAIVVGSHFEPSLKLGPPAKPEGCRRLVCQADRSSSTAVPIDQLMSPASTCIAMMENESLARPHLLPGMLNLLQADDADLVVAYRQSTADSIKAAPEDTEFAARLARALIRLSHTEWQQQPTWQFLMRRQLLSRVRSLSGQRFGTFLDLLRSGKAPWRIVELPLGS